jgi:hypothetical protein
VGLGMDIGFGWEYLRERENIHTYTHIDTHNIYIQYIQTHTYTQYVHTYIYIHTYIHTYTQYVRTYIQHTYVHTRTYIHTYTLAPTFDA